jgi:hypothetical protein
LLAVILNQPKTPFGGFMPPFLKGNKDGGIA